MERTLKVYASQEAMDSARPAMLAEGWHPMNVTVGPNGLITVTFESRIEHRAAS